MPRIKQPMPSGYVTLKIALAKTDISRTIVIPAATRFADLSDAITEIFEWGGFYLWYFESDGVCYGDRTAWEEDRSVMSAGHLKSARLARVANVLPEVGCSMRYTYDPKTEHRHKITRLKDPAEPGTRCIGVSGLGVYDDIGNAKQLMAFTDWLKTYHKNPNMEIPTDFKWAMEWGGFWRADRRKEFLSQPKIEDVTTWLQGAIDE